MKGFPERWIIILWAVYPRSLDALQWGLIPYWAKDPKIAYRTINARAETVDKASSFRQAFAKRRCLIPADGFYEWRKTAKPKLPFAIAMKDGRPFTFAALWENWKDPESGEWLPSAIFCVVALQRALNGFSFCAQPAEISATFREKRLNPLLPLLFAKADPYCSS